MEVDYKVLFQYMLESGLCDESDRAQAKELCDDWLAIYNQTLRQSGVCYAPERYQNLVTC